MGEIVTFKHNANTGDLIAALPGMKHIYDKLGKKSVIYQRLNAPAKYYEDAKHPVKDAKGVQVTMNEKQLAMLTPLLLSQEYIENVCVWQGEKVDISLDKIREGEFSTMGFGSINRWQFYTHPLLACDLSKPWIDVIDNEDIKKKVDGKILLNFTCRYRNYAITYFFLKKYKNHLIFSGTKEEYETFCDENKLKMPYLEVNNFLEVAQAIKHCRFILCNQSFQWNTAEAMKHLRILEVCRSASNCVPNGDFGYDYLHQDAVEIYVKKFMK